MGSGILTDRDAHAPVVETQSRLARPDPRRIDECSDSISLRSPAQDLADRFAVNVRSMSFRSCCESFAGAAPR
jgi:hypothetical protein